MQSFVLYGLNTFILFICRYFYNPLVFFLFFLLFFFIFSQIFFIANYSVKNKEKEKHIEELNLKIEKLEENLAKTDMKLNKVINILNNK